MPQPPPLTLPTIAAFPTIAALPCLDDLLGITAPGTLVGRISEALRDLQHRSVTTSTGHMSGGGADGGGPDGAHAVHAAASISMEDLVREHADAVYRVALSVTRDPSLAEDASQDTLIKAWQSLPSYRGDAPLRHWILRIAHNTSISLLRKRREDVVSPLDFPEGPSTGPTVERQAEHRLAIGRFEEALQDLDGISRSIVVLREIEGLSYSEMSDVLALPLPTIRTRLLRARRQLARALDGWQP